MFWYERKHNVKGSPQEPIFISTYNVEVKQNNVVFSTEEDYFDLPLSRITIGLL